MKRVLVLCVTALAVCLTACDRSTNDVQKSINQVKEQYPVTVNSGDHTTTLDKKPTRIVSLSQTATNDLSAIDASSQVVATNPDFQAIAGYKPELVIAQSDTGNLTGAMRSSNVEVLIQPPAQTVDDVYKQLADLGILTGHINDANQLATRMRQKVDPKSTTLPNPKDFTLSK